MMNLLIIIICIIGSIIVVYGMIKWKLNKEKTTKPILEKGKIRDVTILFAILMVMFLIGGIFMAVPLIYLYFEIEEMTFLMLLPINIYIILIVTGIYIFWYRARYTKKDVIPEAVIYYLIVIVALVVYINSDHYKDLSNSNNYKEIYNQYFELNKELRIEYDGKCYYLAEFGRFDRDDGKNIIEQGTILRVVKILDKIGYRGGIRYQVIVANKDIYQDERIFIDGELVNDETFRKYFGRLKIGIRDIK